MAGLKYETHFDKIENKLDSLDEKLESIIIVQAKQQVILEEHMARTKQVEDALIPLKAQQNQIIGATKLVSGLGIIATIIATLYKVFGK